MTVVELRKVLEQFAPNAPVRVDGLDIFMLQKVGEAVDMELSFSWEEDDAI